MDQVAKLGGHSKTNKAIEIFGNVGLQSIVPQIDTTAVPNLGGSIAAGRKRQTKPISVFSLVAGDVMEKVLRAISMAFDVLVALGKGAVRVCTAHTLLIVLLALSVMYNSWYGYRDGVVWWQERGATNYMARLGVRPEPTIGKAVYLSDIEELVAPTPEVQVSIPFLPSNDSAGKSCRTTFGEQLISSTSLVGAGTRLHRSRDALARYRHDLMVALRVVNRIERDVVLAEWEDWVRAEERKCSRVEQMLLQRRKMNDSGRTHSKVAAEELDAELGADFVEYCSGCRSELAAMRNGTTLM
jgi:hypothetical protein